MSFTQKDVTQFYDSLVFPSRANDSAYSALVPEMIKNGWRVGDFGCGQSVFYSALRHQSPAPIFLDVSLNALRTIDYGLKIQADLCQLPLKNGLFHTVFCIGVVHHLPDMQSGLQELMRVLRTGGLLIIGVYSPRSLGAHLKRIYDGISNDPVRRVFSWAATLMLWTKLRMRFKLSLRDARKRIADLFDTPIVRYLSSECYEKIASDAGLETCDRRQISNMSILFLKKVATVRSTVPESIASGVGSTQFRS